MSSLKTSLMALAFLANSANACYKKSELTKSDCKTFPRPDSGCKRVFLGKRQAEDLTLNLYRSVMKNDKVVQENALLAPSELSRVIASLIHATSASSSPSSTLNETEDAQETAVTRIRCYVAAVTKKLEKTILVSKEKEDEESEKHTDETLTKVNRTNAPRMIFFARRVFIDESLKATKNYSVESLCWYDTEISALDMKTEAAKSVNKWGKEQNAFALETVSNISSRDPASKVRKPLAGDPEVIAAEKVVVASSVYIRAAWKRNLFSKKRTKPSEPFFVKLRGDAPHANSETNVKIPMMTGTEKIHYLDVKSYSAAAIPLAEGLKKAFFIVVLPKSNNENLTDVESEIFGSGTLLHSFLENVHTAEERLVQISLPRLTIQVTHEWGSPDNKSLGGISDESSGEALPASFVGVYQDAFLELTESTSTDPKADKSESYDPGDDPERPELTVNKPFLFIMEVDEDIIAFGRVKDPYWCKFCKDKFGGGNHSVQEGQRKRNDEDEDGFWAKLKNVLSG